MTINVSELRVITEKLFTHLENLGINSVEITEDYYWDIPEEQKYNILKEPKELDVGQLTDDWEFLLKVLEPNREPLGYSFVWLGKLLEAIGEKVIH
jgi:hypothetical protein